MREAKAIFKVMLMTLSMMVISAVVVGYSHFGTGIAKAADAAAAPADAPKDAAAAKGKDAGWDDWNDGKQEEDAFGNIMETTFATIDNITVGKVADGAPVSVSAKVALVDEEGTAKLKSVTVSYSTDGGATVASVPMTDGGDGTYSAAIPAQKTGTRVDFYITAVDTNGNTTTGAIPGATHLVAAVPDIDNSQDIVPDDADLINMSVGYDDTNLYVNYDVQGQIKGGTIDPPYIQLYGVKVTNPDTEQGEGLMVGKLWVYLPLAKDPAVQQKFLPLIMSQAKDFVDKIGKDKFDHVLSSGMLVLDIQKLMGGNIQDGLLFDADPDGTIDGGKFSGHIKRAALGKNPSGLLRVIVLTAANASLDSFMPIPLNCTNFLTIDTNTHNYTVGS